MGDDRHDALAVARDLRQQGRDLCSVCGIEAGGGLVGEHHGGTMCDGSCNGDALLFAVRHLVGPQMRLRGQADDLERAQSALSRVADPPDFKRKPNVLSALSAGMRRND
jgi:hypothetical protein